MRTFHQILVNTLLANVTTSMVWFGLTFWAYLETRSVLVTSVLGGGYMLLIAVLSVPFGTLIDRVRKKTAMVVATVASLIKMRRDAAISGEKLHLGAREDN